MAVVAAISSAEKLQVGEAVNVLVAEVVDVGAGVAALLAAAGVTLDHGAAALGPVSGLLARLDGSTYSIGTRQT